VLESALSGSLEGSSKEDAEEADKLEAGKKKAQSALAIFSMSPRPQVIDETTKKV